MKVLAIGAHPDDLEVLCAGTLARYAKQGHQVVMTVLLNGDKGHYKMNPRKLAAGLHDATGATLAEIMR